MGVVTRKQHFEAAQKVPLQASKRIRTPDDLDDLVRTFALNTALGVFVDTLDVSLRCAFPLATLRRTFLYLPNLTDLNLIIHGSLRAAPLRGVHFPQLQYLRTNLPPRFLIDFLAAHRTITDLDIVGDKTHGAHALCPLRTIAGDLDHLLCISGPARCVARLAGPGLTRLTMTLNDASTTICPLLRSIPAPLAVLYQLTLDFREDDGDHMLGCIAVACPQLRKLKLLEQPARTGRSLSHRRAWDHHQSWWRALRRLSELEELLLRTEAPLVRTAAEVSLERQVVLTWIYGTRRPALRTAARGHPMLYHVGIWYGAGKHGGGCVTHWSKPSGTWKRTISILEPAADYAFI
ncbi:hypothetical protein FKP32DRAFT_1608528 [Trametes sanguinea]|nr:hypothetical protein FKP32DRAFT_1608528 [Trametes sanguinea]